MPVTNDTVASANDAELIRQETDLRALEHHLWVGIVLADRADQPRLSEALSTLHLCVGAERRSREGQ